VGSVQPGTVACPQDCRVVNTVVNTNKKRIKG
jgi:hypothetical protein